MSDDNKPLQPGSGWGIASLVLGILCMVALGWAFSLVGIVFGVLSLNTEGRNLGIAGLILCIIATIYRFAQYWMIHFS